MQLGRLKEIKDLRRVWKHEALDFTPWLAQEDNLALLADAVDLEITLDETESSVGNFNVDIYATETGTDRKIIIENQLEDTNHDHLGKLITYASGKSADIVIWVVKRAREEHRSAIEWLNNHTDENIAFFLVEIKLYQIGNSDIAVKFEVVEKPNDWVKEIKRNTSNSPTLQARYDYWVAFNDYAFQNQAFAGEFGKRKASTDHWMDMSVGSSACHIVINQIRKDNRLVVEWYISDDKDLFHKLYSFKSEIESEMGMKLEWRELPEKKASRILISHPVDFDHKDKWVEQFDWTIDVAMKMKKVFKKYL
ncbi:DUF4268 domain-containing protein [Allobaculum stercoricanis]|uniref:DUF4268 domain-containing protein n=1 Tax=Allobaculum stercoricanis TaxID=174709 RepID=UPI0003685F32|nr:DUF4268 domain-containing protein [Allobaculum stercoricanis]